MLVDQILAMLDHHHLDRGACESIGQARVESGLELLETQLVVVELVFDLVLGVGDAHLGSSRHVNAHSSFDDGRPLVLGNELKTDSQTAFRGLPI